MVQVTCTPGGQGDNAVIVLEKIVSSPTSLNPLTNPYNILLPNDSQFLTHELGVPVV